MERAKQARKICVILTSRKQSNAKIQWYFHDFPLIFKFHDFSMHGIFFSHFPYFPEPAGTLLLLHYSPFITLCLGSIEIDRVISEPCYRDSFTH